MAKFRLRRAGTVREVLEGLGFSADVIDEAEAAGTAELLAIDALVLPGKTKWTIDEVAAKVDVDAAEVRGIWRAFGFADTIDGERAFGKRDAAILKTLAALTREGVADPQTTTQLARVIGMSLANVATAVVDASAASADERKDSDASSESSDPVVDTASSLAVRSRELFPFISEVIDYSFRRHLRAAARRQVMLASSVDGKRQVVGFVDLVRFSELSLRVDERDLAEVVGRFDSLVHEVVVRNDGRVVKMIGDGAMFSVVDPMQAALIALELNDVFAREHPLQGRIGMAHGSVLARDGDLYGPVVNIASRLADIGRAGAINVSQELRDALVGDRRFQLRSLGQRNLRHIGEMRIYRLRPGLPEADPSARTAASGDSRAELPDRPL